MDGIVVPRAYLMSRTASKGLVQTVIAALSITPIACVIISDMKDFPMAHEFGALILRTESDINSLHFAMEIYEQMSRPSLVIGEREGIAAIYEDGRMENLPWQEVSSFIN